MDGSADGLGADGLADRALRWSCASGAVGPRGGCGLGYAGGGLGGFGAGGRRRLGGERSGGCDRRRCDGKRCGRLVGCLCRGSCRRRRCGSRDGNGNGVGRHHGRCILRRLGLNGYRERRRKMPASSRRTSRHRTSARRTSIWRGGSSRPWCRYRSRYRYRPWRQRCPRRVPCRCGLWPRRCDHSNRCAPPCPPCPMRQHGRASGCRTRLAHRRSGAGGRVVLGASVVVAGGRIAVDQRREAVVSGRWLGIRPGGPCRRGLKRCVCRYLT